MEKIANSHVTCDGCVTISVSESDIETAFSTLDNEQICKAFALLKLARHFAFSPQEVAAALTAKRKSRQRCKAFYSAHKAQQKAQRIARSHAATEKKKEDEQGGLVAGEPT